MKKEPSICIREAVASAVNARDMTPGRRAVDMIGALGAAGHNRYFDTGSGRMQARLSAIGTAEINPSRRLASLLDRAKFGMDRHAVKPAIYQFSAYLRERREYAQWRIADGGALLIRFAGSVIFEWLFDRCPQCGGGGQIAVGPVGERNTRTKTCGLCNGCGTAGISHHFRVQRLNLPRAVYEHHWRARYLQAHGWLDAIEESNMAPLRCQLRSRAEPATLPSN